MASEMTVPRAERVGLRDLVAAATVFCWVCAIVQIPPIPISPIIYLPFVLLALSDADMWRAWRRVGRHPAFLWIAGLLLLKGLYLAVIQPATYGTVAEVGRLAAGIVALVALGAYAGSRPARLSRLVGSLIVACGISLAWFLAELAFGPPFVPIRMELYADIYAAKDEGIIETIRSGLTPFLHLLGYQLSAFLPLALVPALSRRRTGWLLLVVPGVAIGLLALVASLQRSALAAFAVAVALMAWYGRRIGRTAGVGLAAAALAAVLAAAAIERTGAAAVLADANLFDKLQSQNAEYDSALRGRLQVRALELLVKYPLGLVEADQSWSNVGFQYVYHRMRAVSTEYQQEFAVHNGYLGDALNFGIGFFVVTVLAIGVVFLTAYRVLRQGDAPSGARVWATAIAGTVVGLYSFQAMTHNASILTLEPVSLVMLALLLAVDAPAPSSAVPAAVPVSAP